uniref:Ribonuclease 3 n=1 Tax=uncultured Spirochaetaceae bacterium TaxID=201186 RepID=A0A650ENM0_9SPIO|nr:hypothetical protein Unknown280_0520 [uncultured Spirochaetaceae bacterium]
MDNQNFNCEDIQSKIGYSFKNKKLLEQAFTRRSYANEHSECADNEVLEFYGDKVLSIYLARWFEQAFAKEQKQSYYSEQKYYFSQKNEGELTKLFSYYSDTEMLSKCIWNLGLETYLFFGKSDENNKVWDNASVAEDLFEAILGAVAIDSEWDFEKIFPVCTKMLGAGKYAENYIRLLQDYCRDNSYIFSDDSFSTLIYLGGVTYTCTLTLRRSQCPYPPLKFKSTGNTAFEAKMEAAKKACKAFERVYMKDCIGGEINPENPVSQLQELYQHEWIDEPKYIWDEEFDEETNEYFWICKIYLESFDAPFFGRQTTKKEAKKEASIKALKELIG